MAIRGSVKLDPVAEAKRQADIRRYNRRKQRALAAHVCFRCWEPKPAGRAQLECAACAKADPHRENPRRPTEHEATVMLCRAIFVQLLKDLAGSLEERAEAIEWLYTEEPEPAHLREMYADLADVNVEALRRVVQDCDVSVLKALHAKLLLADS